MLGRWRVGALVVVAFVALAPPAVAAYNAYVPNFGSSNVSAFSIASDGVLSAVPGSPFAAGTEPDAVAVTPDGNHRT